MGLTVIRNPQNPALIVKAPTLLVVCLQAYLGPKLHSTLISLPASNPKIGSSI